MSFKKRWQRALFSALIIWTIISNGLPVRAQDIVTSEDISGGSSVFVFRQSRKTAQPKSSLRNNFIARNNDSRNKTRQKLFAQTNAVAKTKRTKTKQVDPNLVAKIKTPKKTGGKVTQTDRVSNEQNSVLIAGAAETYLERKNYDMAIENYNLALEFNPKNTDAKLGLSEAYTGKAEETSQKVSQEAAIQYWLKAVETNDKNAAAFAGLGEAYDSTDDNDKAQLNYEKALAINPNLTEIYSPLGVIYYRKGEIAQADNYLMKAAAADSTDVDTKYYLALVRFKQNRNNEALAALEQKVKSEPGSAEAHYYLGALYDRLDRKKDSVVQYDEAVKYKPDYVEAWFDLGVANYNQENYLGAEKAYQQVIKLKMDYGQAYYNLAETYRQLAMSISYVPQAANQPENPQNKKRRDYFDLANSKYTNAEVYIKNDVDLYSNWGFCLARVNKWNLSVEKLNKAVQLNPNAVDYTNLGWAYYNAAQVDLRVNKDQIAAKPKLQMGKAALQKATALNPKFKAAFLNLGVTSTALGEYQDAVNALKSAVDLDDNWLMANNELGLAYLALKDYGNAATYFRKVTQLDDKAGAAWYNLGVAELNRGNIKEAKKAQEKLKKLNPAAANRLDAIIRLGAVKDAGGQIENKIQEKNPLNKIPKLPY